MQRLLEILFGLERGFLSREGEFSLGFNPAWPWQPYFPAAAWNVMLIAAGLGLVVWVYRREGRARPVRILLGVVRAMLLLLVIGLLNRPVVTLGQSRTEASILPILIDDSVSMRVKDVGDEQSPQTRLDAAIALLSANDQRLINDLKKTHEPRVYKFDSTAEAISLPLDIKPVGQETQVTAAVRQVLQDLQGQRVAGVVVLTDGRDSPVRNNAEALQQLATFGVKVYPVVVGSDRPPQNLSVQSVAVQDAAFVGDIVNVRATLRGSGYPQGHQATVRLVDKTTSQVLQTVDGKPAEERITLDGDAPIEAELQFRPTTVGTLDVGVEIVAQPAEIDEDDNSRITQLAVLDAKINVLYVDGYPRWEYRYLKQEMIRDKTVDISCLLTSADPTFRQEGDRPITRFPESLNEMMEYDVIVLGDVDPRQFSDFQLQLVSEFVSKMGGGFAMVAGPQFSPQAFRGTALEAILPVNIERVTVDRGGAAITQGFRPALTKLGGNSSIFRFFGNRAENEKFISEQIQPLFWYCRGVWAKPGIGETYAEHPIETGPDGRKAPLLVLGRFGAGRTAFGAIDDTWRWRYYTGETIFDTYWIQQLRYLARGRKLGQRQVSLSSLRAVYELGEQSRLNLRILNPQLLPQLPEQIRVDIIEEPSQAVVAQQMLIRQEGQPELYTAAFAADRIGAFSAKVASIAGGVDDLAVPYQVRVPRVELASPQVDRAAMQRLATQTGGELINFADAATRLPTLVLSAARVIPIETARPLWDAPLAMALFVLLVTIEWALRKMFGMV